MYIYKNYSLEHYNRRFKNLTNNLPRFKEKEVLDFDKKYSYLYNKNEKNILLKNHDWFLIDGTYYQVPSKGSFVWFRNLRGGVQLATCLLTGGVILGATAGGISYAVLHKDFIKSEIVSKDKDNIEIKPEKEVVVGEPYKAKITVKQSSKTVEDQKYLPAKIQSVKTGDVTLSEWHKTSKIRSLKDEEVEPENYYTYTLSGDNTSAELFIKKILGPVEVTFNLVTVKNYSLKSLPERINYILGETFTSKGLALEVSMSDGTTQEISSGFSHSTEEGAILDKEGNFTDKITYKDFKLDFKYTVTDTVMVHNSEELLDVMMNQRNITTIVLDAGEYCLHDIIPPTGWSNTNAYTLLGQGMDKTTYLVGGTTEHYGQANGDWTFSTNASMSFNNMKIKNRLGNSGYQGFVGVPQLYYKNCEFNETTMFWGSSDSQVVIDECVFNQPTYNAYALWTYSGGTFKVSNSIFNTNGKTILLNREYGAHEPCKFYIDNCIFSSSLDTEDEEAKPILNIQDYDRGIIPTVFLKDLYFDENEFHKGDNTNSPIFDVKDLTSTASCVVKEYDKSTSDYKTIFEHGTWANNN